MERRWKVMIVTSASVIMAQLDVSVVNIAFPDIRLSFPHEPLANLSWLLNAYSVVFAAGLVPAGRLADRFGRRRMFLTGVVVFLTASVLCGLAGSVEILVAARVLQALGAAAVMPTSFSLVLPEFPVERRATAAAAWAATGAVAAAVGPALGTGTVAELPRPRYATGIGIAACLRQLGAVVGVAALIAIIGTPGPERIITVFHRTWVLIAACGALLAMCSIGLGRVRARQVDSLPPGGGPAAASASVSTRLPAE
jgi:MFS family permease